MWVGGGGAGLSGLGHCAEQMVNKKERKNERKKETNKECKRERRKDIRNLRKISNSYEQALVLLELIIDKR